MGSIYFLHLLFKSFRSFIFVEARKPPKLRKSFKEMLELTGCVLTKFAKARLKIGWARGEFLKPNKRTEKLQNKIG